MRSGIRAHSFRADVGRYFYHCQSVLARSGVRWARVCDCFSFALVRFVMSTELRFSTNASVFCLSRPATAVCRHSGPRQAPTALYSTAVFS